MHTLTVEMKVPIQCEPVIGAPALTFAHWLPLGKEHGILVSQDGVDLLLWFDLGVTHGLQAKDISHQQNVLVMHVRVDARVKGVDGEMATYMRTKDFTRQPTPEEAKVQQSYDKVASNVLRLTVDSVNRLVAYGRAIKGQYWLLDLPLNLDLSQAFIQFKAVGSIDGGPPFRFQPNTNVRLSIVIPGAERYITEDDWPAAMRFVQGDQRTPFVLDLLARAERLASQGHSRTALTEAVTALEIALSAFGDSKSAAEKLAGVFGPRLGIAKLGGQIKTMGVRGSVRFLLPMLLPEDVLPLEVVTGCQQAVDERNNVVHNGQRDVEDVKKYVMLVRRCCEILRDYEG